jgi:uncharacterized membrane protein
MGWMGLVLGLLAAWVIGEIVGWHGGGLVVLGGLGGWLISRLQQRLTRSEHQIQLELKSLREQLTALQGRNTEQSLPTTEAVAADTSDAPLFEPVQTKAPLPAIPWMQAGAEPPTDAMAKAASAPTLESDWIDTQPGSVASARSSRQALASPPPTDPTHTLTEADEKSLEVTTSLGASLRAWFTGGNTIVRVAVLILFIGVAFLLRYAAERTTVPIELRLTGVVLVGVGLVALGRRLLHKRRGYALSLQGAGVGMVYLTLFAAYRLYGLMPSGLAFGLLGLMAAITAVLAVSQNALPLAVLGFGGAFLAPVLTSTGQGSHVGLFSYCLLLNLAIAWIAQRQAWKLLNVVGFFFTFTLAGAWGAKAYMPEYFWTTEPFLIVHFLLYLFIAVQYTQRILKSDTSTGSALPAVDGSLLFGVPIVAFGLQAAMLKDQPLALAASAAVLSAIYLLVGRWLWRQAGQKMLVLVEGLLALGVIFLALVVPLALDARWTAAAWAIQGAGVLWVGLRQRRWWAAGMGLLLQGGAAVTFWRSVSTRTSGWAIDQGFLPATAQDLTPFLNDEFFGVLVLAGAALFSARLLKRQAQDTGHETATSIALLPQPLHLLMLGLGAFQLWWFGWLECYAWPQSTLDMALLGALWSALLAVVFELAQQRLRWPELRWPARAFMLVALLASTSGLLDHVGSVQASWTRLASGWGWLEALGLTALGLWLLRRQQDDEPTPWQAAQGVVLAWYTMLHSGWLLYTAGAHLVARHEGWTPAAAMLLPTLIALFLIGRAALQRFPVGEQWMAYRRFVFQPWQALLALWVLAVNAFSDASMAPLPYLPLLNPIDLAHGLILVYCIRLSRLGTTEEAMSAPTTPWAKAVTAALAFWWLNALLIRTLHHWAGTPMWWNGALDSALVQTSLTVLWTLSALVTMLYATRKASAEQARRLWMVGAALLAVVVLKLFVVDLSNVGTLQRIVSFLAVGGLMLVIGYVSPMPPAAGQAQQEQNT